MTTAAAPTTIYGYTIVDVADVPATLGFSVEAFGFTRRFVTPEEDYGELDTGGMTLAFASEPLARANLDGAGGFTPVDASMPPPGVSLTMLSDDVASAVERAVGAGATPYTPPTEKPWGQTVADVRDPDGLLIELATPMPA